MLSQLSKIVEGCTFKQNWYKFTMLLSIFTFQITQEFKSDYHFKIMVNAVVLVAGSVT